MTSTSAWNGAGICCSAVASGLAIASPSSGVQQSVLAGKEAPTARAYGSKARQAVGVAQHLPISYSIKSLSIILLLMF
jgi:hypothetical protein